MNRPPPSPGRARLRRAPWLPCLLALVGSPASPVRGEPPVGTPGAAGSVERCNQAIPIQVLRRAGEPGMSGLPEDGTEAPRSDPMGAAPASGPTAPSAAGAPEPPHAPSPPEFAPSRGRDCHRYRRRRVCEGPRRVPVPHGPAAERAERLGLGSRSVASRLLTGSPDPRWRAAAPRMRSCPQAASDSTPRDQRTVVTTPALVSGAWKAATASDAGRRWTSSGTGL